MENTKVTHIFYVDDDIEDLEFFKYSLEEIFPDIHLSTISDSTEILTSLYTVQLPDVILLDMNMPLCNGIECLKQLKDSAIFSKIPVVLYSTSKSPVAIKKSKEYGAAHFIKKGTSTAEVSDFIKNLCNKTLEPLDMEV